MDGLGEGVVPTRGEKTTTPWEDAMLCCDRFGNDLHRSRLPRWGQILTTYAQCLQASFVPTSQAGYSSVGRASDCRDRRNQMVSGSIPGGRIFSWVLIGWVLVVANGASEHDGFLRFYALYPLLWQGAEAK